MNPNKYSMVLTPYEYTVLNKNALISMLYQKQLQSATTYKNDDGEEEVELSMTLVEFDDLIGYVAAESNHARTKNQREDLDALCDYLEGQVGDIKRRQ